ncbi:hypothetical protein lerEdw1_002969 [Lerista edwardsae]|nr:hypothetical protein lerEdw1_002969 [Lerista edwardsae]
MATPPRSFSPAVLAWVLLNLSFPSKAEGTEADIPCEKHLRSRQGIQDLGSNWGFNLVWLGLFFACVILLAGYIFSCICGSKELCAQEGCSEFCPNVAETGGNWCGPAAPVASRTRARSSSPMCVEAQQAYAQQLTCIEKLMEGFLSEVRGRRKAVEKVLGQNLGAPGRDCSQSKLNITVYEIADREGSRRA